MKLFIAATAALALVATPVLAHGHHNSGSSKTHSGGSSSSKGDKKGGDKNSKGDDSNPFSSLLKNFSKLKPHN